MQLKLKYFYDLTPRQFCNTERGFRKYQEVLSKERFIQTRKIMWATSFPHLKNVKETDLMPFPWDQNMIKEITAEESEKLVKDAEKVKEFYKKQDELKKNQTA